jgi:hypothetical protein
MKNLKNITKVILAVMVLSAVSCKKLIEENEKSKDLFHPPQWIQGIWLENNGTDSPTGYQFTENDFYLVHIYNLTTDQIEHRESFTDYINVHFSPETRVTEEITSSDYKINFIDSDGTTDWWKFTHVGNTIELRFKDVQDSLVYYFRRR